MRPPPPMNPPDPAEIVIETLAIHVERIEEVRARITQAARAMSALSDLLQGARDDACVDCGNLYWLISPIQMDIEAACDEIDHAGAP